MVKALKFKEYKNIFHVYVESIKIFISVGFPIKVQVDIKLIFPNVQEEDGSIFWMKIKDINCEYDGEKIFSINFPEQKKILPLKNEYWSYIGSIISEFLESKNFFETMWIQQKENEESAFSSE